jgi:hypothetical protein
MDGATTAPNIAAANTATIANLFRIVFLPFMLRPPVVSKLSGC